MKIDRLDIDELERMRQTAIWRDYEGRIRKRLESAMRNCTNSSLDEKALRVAQGEVAALQFVIGVPDQIQKEVERGIHAG